MSAQDPFYTVKEEIQETIDKLQSSFHKWERFLAETGEQVHLKKELLAGCESISWQVDELDKTVTVAAKNPAWYGINEVELEKRRRWTSNARSHVGNLKKVVLAGKGGSGAAGPSFMRQELMRMPNSSQTDNHSRYAAEDEDDFIQSESDRQLLLIKQQDEELDELSLSVQRIGGVGLTVHDELVAQEKIIDELGMEMDSTKNGLDFVQIKSGNGDEESWSQGADNDDMFPGALVYHPLCSGVLKLIPFEILSTGSSTAMDIK